MLGGKFLEFLISVFHAHDNFFSKYKPTCHIQAHAMGLYLGGLIYGEVRYFVSTYKNAEIDDLLMKFLFKPVESKELNSQLQHIFLLDLTPCTCKRLVERSHV